MCYLVSIQTDNGCNRKGYSDWATEGRKWKPWPCQSGGHDAGIDRSLQIHYWHVLGGFMKLSSNFANYSKRSIDHNFQRWNTILSFHLYIGNFATYDTHMCCLSYENHMKNICVSYAYLIIWASYVASHMRII